MAFFRIPLATAIAVVLFALAPLLAQTRSAPPAAPAQPAAAAVTPTPESAGFSTAGLAKLDAGMQGLVDAKKLAGLATILERHGKIVEEKAYGAADIAGARPMMPDSIVRIYSMTKPITGVAMMMLYEEGKWKPTDPIAKYIPEFKDLKVFTGTGSDGTMTLAAPAHAPTMSELMSHSAGFTYGIFGNTPVDEAYRAAGLLKAPSLHELITRMAKLPLLYQPGTEWNYSLSVDIQGYVVEKLSGMSFPDFLQRRIFQPLGMKDTGFFVPHDKLDRVATIYAQRGGALFPMPRDAGISTTPGVPSGGGGLYSTADDYLLFAQMLAKGGQANGMQLLKPETIDLMRTNHVSDEVRAAHKYGIGGFKLEPGLGYGYDLAVYDDPVKIGSTMGKGTYFWNGLAGTFFWIDPTNDLIFVGMPQLWLLGGGTNGEQLARNLTYQALVDPAK